MAIFQNKKDYFALSFSDYQLHFIQVSKKGKLQRHLEKKLEPGIIERGQVKNKEKLRQSLKELFKLAKPKQKFVVVGLPEVKAFTRTFQLPSLSIEELSDAARWESEPLLPFSLDKAYLDWMILEKDKEIARVLVVALPQELVEEYALLLEDLNFQPIAFEITSLSLARLIKKNKTTSLIIDIKKAEAVLVIVGARGGIEVSSTIFFGNESEVADEVSLTVNNLLNFYRKKVSEKDQNKKVKRVLFCGGGVQKELVKRIEKEIGLPSSMLAVKQTNLASFISLARKNVAAPTDEKTINLIPPRIQGIYDQVAMAREVSLWLKLTLLCFFLIFFGYSVIAAHTYFETKRIEGKTIELQAAATPKLKELGEKAEFLNRRAQIVTTLNNSQSEIATLFPLIREKTPSGIILNQLSFDDNKNVIFVSGLASLREELLSFREALEKTEKFGRVHIPLTSLEKEADVSFTISLIGR